MAATTTTSFPAAVSAPAADNISYGLMRRRSIDPRSGRALEILGHAIEYLADEFIYQGGLFSAKNSQVQAVQLLMALNREIYLACPEVPPLSTRILAFLHLKAN